MQDNKTIIRYIQQITNAYKSSCISRRVVTTCKHRICWIADIKHHNTGTPITNIVPLADRERITAWIPVHGYDQGGYLFMVTKNGYVKKTELAEFDTVLRSKGLNALTLGKGDELRWVLWTDGKKDIVLATKLGKAVRFHEDRVRAMGRTARGVQGIKLRKGDELVAAVVVDKKDPRDLLTVSELGLGKRTALADYPRKSRNTQGVLTLKVTKKNGPVVGVQVVEDEDEIMCITSAGVLIRMPVEKIRRTGRNAQGVKVVTPDDGATVSAVAKVVREAGGIEDED